VTKWRIETEPVMSPFILPAPTILARFDVHHGDRSFD